MLQLHGLLKVKQNPSEPLLVSTKENVQGTLYSKWCTEFLLLINIFACYDIAFYISVLWKNIETDRLSLYVFDLIAMDTVEDAILNLFYSIKISFLLLCIWKRSNTSIYAQAASYSRELKTLVYIFL